MNIVKSRIPCKGRVRAVSCLILSTALQLLAQSSGADGVAIVDAEGNTREFASTLARGADGRLYVAAELMSFNPNVLPLHRLFAFDAAGQLVAGFGVGGRAVSPQTSAALAVRPDGSVVVVGGFPLSTFSPAGQLQSPVAQVPLSVRAVALQGDGQIVVGGRSSSDMWALARLRPDGTLDPAFANGAGLLQRDAGISIQISGLELLASGKILAIGPGRQNEGAVLGRFNADGTIDFTFGTNGLIELPSCTPLCVGGPRVDVDSTGRIYLLGGSTLVARLNADGSVDSGYASVAADPALQAVDIALDSADRAVIFGTVAGIVAREGYIARLLPSGARDTAFGSAGEVFVRIGAGNQEALAAGLLQPDDKPVAALTVAGPWDGTPSLLGPTDFALVRLTTSGQLDTTFAANHIDADVYPDAFSFISTSAPFGTTSVVSNSVQVSGINGRTSVSIGGAAANAGYSIGCTGVFTNEDGTLLPGDTLCVRHTASSAPGGSSQTAVNVGGRTATYLTVSTSQSADVVPDSFSFTDQNDVAPGATVVSAPVNVTGLTGAAAVAIDGGQYSVGCDPAAFTTLNGTVTNGQTICVRHVAASQYSSSVNTTLAIGGVTDVFTSRTAAADLTPDAFTFAPQGNVQPGVRVTSNAVTIAGINAAAPISIVGGEYSIGCSGTWSTQAGTIRAGEQICVAHTSASSAASSTTTTLTVESVSATFVSTTAPSQPRRGGGGGSLSLFQLFALLILLFCRSLSWRTT